MFTPRRRRNTLHKTLVSMAISSTLAAEDALSGTVVGTFTSGISGGSYSLTDNVGGKFAIVGSDLQVSGLLYPGTYPVAVKKTVGTSESKLSTNIVVSAVNGPAYKAVGALLANTTLTSINIALPASGAVNDILVLMAFCAGTNTDFDVPAGWNVLAQVNAGSAKTSYFWKRHSGAEGATVTLTNASRTSTNMLAGVVLAYSGCVTTGTPFESLSTFSTASGVMMGVPVTTTRRKGLGVQLVIRAGINSRTGGQVSWTENLDIGSGSAVSICADSRVIEFPGTVPAVNRGGTTFTVGSVGFALIGTNASPVATNPPPRRGMWVWDWQTYVLANDTNTAALLSACTTYGLTDLYCYTYGSLVGMRTKMQNFIAAASAQGVRVWGLDGDRGYLADAGINARDPLIASINGLIAHNAASAANQRFYGFHMDVEPADSASLNLTSFHNGKTDAQLSTTSGGVWKATEALDREMLMRDFVDLTKSVRALCNANGMKLMPSMSSWYDNYFNGTVSCTYDGVTQIVSKHIYQNCDAVAIMSYRTLAETIRNEIMYEYYNASATNPMCEIGFSIETMTGEGATVTYGDALNGRNTKTAALADIAAIEDEVKNYPAHRYVNIHSWEGWRNLAN